MPKLIYSQSSQSSNLEELQSLAQQQYKSFLVYKNAGDTKLAMGYLIKYETITDSINKLHRARQLAEINAKFENDKKAREVNLLLQENKLKELRINQNRFMIFGISGIAILLVIIISLALRQHSLRSNERTLALEQTLLRSQMNPHFIFNTLTNIQSFIIRNETGASIKYLDNFSELIKTILESSGKRTIPLQTELLTIINYFKLQKLRFGDKLEYNIEVDPDCDPGNINLPPMMIQPLVENAIIHGIKPKQGKGRVDVRFKMKDAGLVIEVQDNGVGRNYARENPTLAQSPHSGLALVILRERLASMNTKREKNNRFEIIDLFDENNNSAGTLVRLELDSHNL